MHSLQVRHSKCMHSSGGVYYSNVQKSSQECSVVSLFAQRCATSRGVGLAQVQPSCLLLPADVGLQHYCHATA
jgi:hypothetical protein